MSELRLLRPAWAMPLSTDLGAAMSTRHGGVSERAFASLNLGGTAGDLAAHVADNRRRFQAALGARPVWLRQVHGNRVLRLDAALLQAAEVAEADAAWTTAPGMACTVLVADCLPVLLAARDGSVVAAAHAGWRGLAAGVLESTVDAMRAGAGVPAHELMAWLGPCIGRAAFEVGADVLQGFGAAPDTADAALFRFRARADGSPRWLADLPALAAMRLQQAGVSAEAISRSGLCTVANGSDFFSFRRDGVTGRMAASIWRRG